MVTYRNATQNDMKQIALVHKECFPEYFLTSFGVELLEQYYLEFLKENDLFIIASDNNRIIGFCMGYYGGSKARKNFETKNRKAIIKKLVGQCIRFNTVAIKKCLSRVINITKTQSSFVPDVDLLSICLLPAYRGTGVSKKLVEIFQDRFLATKNVTNCTLTVIADNTRARIFYEKIGFQVFKENEDEIKYIKYYN